MSKSGGLLQLVSTGRQDIYLTGNPQMTFFRQVYRRYTNFSVETQRIAFETAVDFGKLASLTIPQSGDLLSQLMLEIRLPKLNALGATQSTGCSGVQTTDPINFADTDPTFSWANDVGHAMIDYISFQIGQQEIDRQTGEWLHIWSQLTTPYSKYAGYNDMVGYQEVFSQQTQQGPLQLFVPLGFWFCRNIGLSLPLIALQSTPIRIYIKFKSGYDMVYSNSLQSDPCQTVVSQPFVQDIALWGDFVYLDVEERRRFASSRHEYLIEQLQYIKRYSVAEGVQNVSIPLNFNHPLKEIIWVAQQDRMLSAHEWFNYGSRALNEAGVPNLDLLDSGDPV